MPVKAAPRRKAVDRSGEDEEFMSDGIVARVAERVIENPAMSGGLFVMALTATAIFSNAMFMQSGRHPEPLFATRPAPAVAGKPEPDVPLPRTRAERPPETPAAVAAVPAPAPAPPPAARRQLPPTDPALVASLQRTLAARGLYRGAIDGIFGSRTRSAILAYQRSTGLPQTGEPSMVVLEHIRLASAPKPAPVAVPPVAPAPVARAPAPATAPPSPPAPVPVAVRPVPVVTPAPVAPPRVATAPVPAAPAPVVSAPAPAAPVTSISELVAPEAPVAATLPPPIPVRPEASPAAPAPVATASRPAPVPAAVPPLASVPAAPDPAQQRYAAIQRALNKIGYGPVEEDGFGGGETADAIRRFELDNGLPITGSPGERVVNRLVAIGAMPKP